MQKVIGALLVLAALALATYAWVLSKRMAAEKEMQMQQVVVAAERIEAGTRLTADKLRLMDFPARPPGSYGEVTSLIGQVTPVDIAAGEALLAERMTAAAVVPLKRLEADERAVAIRVDEVIAVGNRLTPGDRVDVFATFRRNNEEIPDSHARLLLADLRVLAFGKEDKPEGKTGGRPAADSPPRTAVLAVPLADVDKLALAVEAGRVLLALRPLAIEGEAAAPAGEVVAKAAASAPAQVVSLRELVGAGAPRAAAAGKPAAGSGKPAALSAVKVMHGFEEKTVYLGSKKNGAGQ